MGRGRATALLPRSRRFVVPRLDRNRNFQSLPLPYLEIKLTFECTAWFYRLAPPLKAAALISIQKSSQNSYRPMGIHHSPQTHIHGNPHGNLSTCGIAAKISFTFLGKCPPPCKSRYFGRKSKPLSYVSFSSSQPVRYNNKEDCLYLVRVQLVDSDAWQSDTVCSLLIGRSYDKWIVSRRHRLTTYNQPGRGSQRELPEGGGWWTMMHLSVANYSIHFDYRNCKTEL